MAFYYAPIDNNLFEFMQLGIPLTAPSCLLYLAAADEDKNIFIKFDKDGEPTRFFKGKLGNHLYVEVDEPDLIFDKEVLGFMLDFTKGDITSNKRRYSGKPHHGDCLNFYAAKKISNNEIYIYSYFYSFCYLSGFTGEHIVVYRYEPNERLLQPLCRCELYKKNGEDPELTQVIGKDPYFHFQKWEEGVDQDQYFNMIDNFYQSKVITKRLQRRFPLSPTAIFTLLMVVSILFSFYRDYA